MRQTSGRSARLIGRQVRVSLRASELVVFDARTVVARHPRVVARGGESVDLDHYLDVLKLKPGALPGSTALAHARATGSFTAAHEAFWAAARKTDGDAVATRELIDVLLLHRSMDAVDVVAGLQAALTVGAVTADVVAVEARLHATRHPETPGKPASSRDRVRFLTVEQQRAERRVVSLNQRRLADPAAVIAGLPPDRRPMPSMAGYDELLQLRSLTFGKELPAREETGS